MGSRWCDAVAARADRLQKVWERRGLCWPSRRCLTNPRLDRPETANRLAGRSPPSKADRASGVPPHEVARLRSHV